MSHGKVIQTRCDDALVSRIESYRGREELRSDSAAVRKLLTFALDILDSSVDAPSVSNRQLLEEMFKTVKMNEAVMGHIHAFTYRNNITDKEKSELKEMKLIAKSLGRESASKFLGS